MLLPSVCGGGRARPDRPGACRLCRPSRGGWRPVGRPAVWQPSWLGRRSTGGLLLPGAAARRCPSRPKPPAGHAETQPTSFGPIRIDPNQPPPTAVGACRLWAGRRPELTSKDVFYRITVDTLCLHGHGSFRADRGAENHFYCEIRGRLTQSSWADCGHSAGPSFLKSQPDRAARTALDSPYAA
jgi:hypothetical protein